MFVEQWWVQGDTVTRLFRTLTSKGYGETVIRVHVDLNQFNRSNLLTLITTRDSKILNVKLFFFLLLNYSDILFIASLN